MGKDKHQSPIALHRQGSGRGKADTIAAPPSGFDMRASTPRVIASQGKMAKKGSRARECDLRAQLRLSSPRLRVDVHGASGPNASGSYSAPRAGPGPSTLSQVSSLNVGGAGGALAGGSQANGMPSNTPLFTLCNSVGETALTRKPSSSTTIPRTKHLPPSASPHHGVLAGLPVAPSAPRNDPRTRTKRHRPDIPSLPSLRSPHPPPVVPTRSS